MCGEGVSVVHPTLFNGRHQVLIGEDEINPAFFGIIVGVACWLVGLAVA